MSQKPGGKKDKKADASAPPPSEPLPEEEPIDGRQLWLATDALMKAKAARNFHQLERDKINAFWEITKREIEATKAELRNKERERAEAKERHEVELKVYKQKMRHLLYEHKVHISAMKLEAERALKNRQEEHREREAALRTDCRDLKTTQKEQELLHRSMKGSLAQQQAQELTEQLKGFERELKETHLMYDKKIKALREEMENKRKEDIAIIEKRKEEHIEELKEMHDKAFKDIRDYYTEITSSNLETIKTLKEEVYSRKNTEAGNEKAMFEIANANRKLTEPLTRAQKQKERLDTELTNYESDRALLKTTKQRLRELEQRYKTLTWEHEVLGQRYAKLQEDRDLIFDQYSTSLQQVQQKAVFKRVLLHRKLEVAQQQLERKDAQLGEVLKNANVDEATVRTVERKLDDLLADKNRTIEDLQQLLAALTLRHDKAVQAYEVYVRQNGIFGLQP